MNTYCDPNPHLTISTMTDEKNSPSLSRKLQSVLGIVVFLQAHTTFPFLSDRRKKVYIKIEKKHNPKARTPKTQNGASTDVNDTIRIHATDTLHSVDLVE